MDDARHTSATRGMASDARTNRAKAYAYACGLAIGAFAVVAGAMRDGRAGTMTAVARRAMTGDGGTREGATAMTEDEKGTTTTTRTDEDEDANEDEDVGEMERRFTRCAGQCKKLLADDDAYFERFLEEERIVFRDGWEYTLLGRWARKLRGKGDPPKTRAEVAAPRDARRGTDFTQN